MNHPLLGLSFFISHVASEYTCIIPAKSCCAAPVVLVLGMLGVSPTRAILLGCLP